MNEIELASIHDEGPGDRYFHIMLNMADDDLDPYEYRLLGHYRRVCGARNVPCTETTRQTADRCRMSIGKVAATRQRLVETGWIRLSQDGNRLVVTLVDRMPENVRRYTVQSDSSPGEHHASAGIPAYRSPDELSPHEQDALPSEKSFTTRTICSPDERSVHQVNETFTTRTICSPDERSVHQVNETFTTRTICSPHERSVHQVNETFTTRTICSPHERSPYIEKQQKQQKPIQEPPTTTSAPARPTSAELVAPAGVGGGVGGSAETEQISEDDLAFILPEVRKLHLSAEAQKRLLGLGAQTALAIAFAARAQGVRNPGGLAVKLMDNGGPSEADQERAALALSLRTLDAETLDRYLRRRDYARLMEQASTLAKTPEPPPQPASPPASPMIPQPAEPAQPAPPAPDPAQPARQPAPTTPTPDGLDEQLGAMTAREWFVLALMQWQVRLNAPSYRSYFEPLQPVRYADGVLTVRATRHLAYQWMSDEGRVTLYVQEALQRVSGLPLQVRLIGPDESIEELEPGDAVVAAEVVAQPELVPEQPAEPASAGSAETAAEQLTPPRLDPAELPGLWQQVLAHLREHGLFANRPELHRLQVAVYADGVVGLQAASWDDYRELETRVLTLGYIENLLRTQAGQPVQLRLLPPAGTLGVPEQEVAQV